MFPASAAASSAGQRRGGDFNRKVSTIALGSQIGVTRPQCRLKARQSQQNARFRPAAATT